jgi:hypothetical protein
MAALVVVAGAVMILGRDSRRICPKVYVAGVNLAGLSVRAVHSGPWLERLRRVVPAAASAVVVRVADGVHRCKLGDVGVFLNLDEALDRAYAVGRTGPPRSSLAIAWHPASAVPTLPFPR